MEVLGVSVLGKYANSREQKQIMENKKSKAIKDYNTTKSLYNSQKNDSVNIEFDMIGKYVQRLHSTRKVFN